MKLFKLVLILMMCGSLFSCAKKSSKKKASNSGNSNQQNGQNYQNPNYQQNNQQYQNQQQANNQNGIPYYGNNGNSGGILSKITNMFRPQVNSNSFLMGTAFSILSKLFGLNISSLNTSFTSNATFPGAQFISQFNDPVSQIEIFNADNAGANCAPQSRVMMLSNGYSNAQYLSMCNQFSSNQAQAGAVKINGACQKVSGQSVYQVCHELAAVMGN